MAARRLIEDLAACLRTWDTSVSPGSDISPAYGAGRNLIDQRSYLPSPP
jgi:hypothetical protein